MAGRLANKLADYVKQYSIPQHTIDRIQEELKWVGLTPKQKTQQLLGQTRFSGSEFRRMGELIKELLKQGHGAEASAIGKHYFETLDEGREIPTEDLSRIPDFLRSMAGVRTDFWPQAAARLAEELKREPFSQFRDLQVTNCLTSLSKTVAIYEDFELVLAVGSAIERRVNSDPSLHKECCAPALRNMLNLSSVDRILEIFEQKHDDSGWSKTASTLLRWSGPAGVEPVFRELEEQKAAGIRLALLRLIIRIGPAAADAARQRLSHPHWYVVRNACKVLAGLKHPQLLDELAPLLRHAEQRVQQAAFQALIESRVPGRAAVFAEMLPHLNPHLMEQALNELIFLKDPASLPGLEAFVTAQTAIPIGAQANVLLKAVHA